MKDEWGRAQPTVHVYTRVSLSFCKMQNLGGGFRCTLILISNLLYVQNDNFYETLNILPVEIKGTSILLILYNEHLKSHIFRYMNV